MHEGKVAVVTGASAGVGRATARALAGTGFDVALLARGATGLDQAAAEVSSAGHKALPIEVDVSRHEDVDRAAGRVESELGPIDVWVNDAMATVFSPVWDVDPADFEQAVRVTFLGQVWGTRAALARMRTRDRGTIVNVGSALAFIGIPLQSAYCASKFACRGFFQSTRAELLADGSHVRLCMVHLPAVNTPQFNWCRTTLDRHPRPVAPVYQPEVVARRIVASALDGRPERVVGSWNRMLVAAGSMFPRFGNQYAALGAWDSQLTSDPVSPGRPANLYQPQDEGRDAGARGSFDGEARGIFDPEFLRSLPTVGKNFLAAASRTLAEKRRVGGSSR